MTVMSSALCFQARARRAAVRIASGALFLSSPALVQLTAQGSPAAPRNGTDVLERMHAAYAGRWYHTLTFVQSTTMRRQNGTDTVQTWYESLRHTGNGGTRLRIDFGDPANGNGVLYTADSSYRMRDGKLARASAEGNEFLPLIEGVYVQPVERTVKELAPTKVDLKRVTTGKWKGNDVWIVGTDSPADTASPQFWVDTKSKAVVRMILVVSPTLPPMDIHLGGYEKAGRGVLATKIEMFAEGVRRQAEDYSDWKTDVDLDPALFEVATWSTAKHWAKPTK
jgi:hypothetical protein